MSSQPYSHLEIIIALMRPSIIWGATDSSVYVFLVDHSLRRGRTEPMAMGGILKTSSSNIRVLTCFLTKLVNFFLYPNCVGMSRYWTELDKQTRVLKDGRHICIILLCSSGEASCSFIPRTKRFRNRLALFPFTLQTRTHFSINQSINYYPRSYAKDVCKGAVIHMYIQFVMLRCATSHPP